MWYILCYVQLKTTTTSTLSTAITEIPGLCLERAGGEPDWESWVSGDREVGGESQVGTGQVREVGVEQGDLDANTRASFLRQALGKSLSL